MSNIKKILNFEDFELPFVKIGNVWRISLRYLADYYDIEFKHANEIIKSNLELFRDLDDLKDGRVTRPSIYENIDVISPS